MRGARLFLSVLLLFSPAACSKTANVVESRALTVDFGSFPTGSVEIDSKGIAGGEKAGADMLAYLETKLRQGGVLEVDKGGQLIVRLRAAAHNDATEDFRMLVDFVDAKSGSTVGQITVAGSPADDKTGASLRRIADEIVEYMRANRRTAVKAKADAPQPSPATTGNQPTAGGVTKGACTTTCTPDASSALPSDDRTRIAERIEPMLVAVRGCLDQVSAQSIHPAAILLFEGAGQLSKLTIDAGGYDELACVTQARARPPQVRVSRGSSVRCEYRCK